MDAIATPYVISSKCIGVPKCSHFIIYQIYRDEVYIRIIIYLKNLKYIHLNRHPFIALMNQEMNSIKYQNY